MSKLGRISVLLVLPLLGFFSNQPQASPTPDTVARQHIQEIISALPVDSSLRRTLEAGHYGSGIHQSWMDDMRRTGVKLAMFEIQGLWRSGLGFLPVSVSRVIYRKAYDGPGSQIIDESDLQRIRTAGLEEQLRKAAFEKARRATQLFVIDSTVKSGEKCFTNIYLFDDEWLADTHVLSDSPAIGRYDPEEFPLHSAAAVGDKLNIAKLFASRHFTKDDLNTALFSAVKYPSDNTDVISLLFRAGADVNAQRNDGTTPLMTAVALLNLSNIKLLLSSGADVSRKTTIGWTAYSLALQQLKQFQDNGARPPEYMPEMLKLLKPPSTDH